jgi:hypothetical protein
VAYEVEEEVRIAFASQDLRGDYGGRGIGLPIEKLPKNWRQKFDTKRKQEYEERKKAAQRERQREEAKVMKRKKAVEQSGSIPASNTRGSTPLDHTAETFSLPDLSKPPPATQTTSSTGSTPANLTNVKEKKIPSLFDFKFPDKTKPRFPIVIPKIVPVKPVPNIVPPTPYPNMFTKPPLTL